MKWSTNRRTKCGQSVMRIKTAYYDLCFEELFYKKDKQGFKFLLSQHCNTSEAMWQVPRRYSVLAQFSAFGCFWPHWL